MNLLANLALLVLFLSLSSSSPLSGAKTWSYLGKSGPKETISVEYGAINEWLIANADGKDAAIVQFAKAGEYFEHHEAEINGELLRSAWRQFVALKRTQEEKCDRESVEILINNMNQSGAMGTQKSSRQTRVAIIVKDFAKRHAFSCSKVYPNQYDMLLESVEEPVHSFAETFNHHLRILAGPKVLFLDKEDPSMREFFKEVERSNNISPIARAMARTISQFGDYNERLATGENLDGRKDIDSRAVSSGVAKVFHNCAKYVETFGNLMDLVEFDAKVYSSYDYFSARLTTAWSTVQVCRLIRKRDQAEIVNKIVKQFYFNGRKFNIKDKLSDLTTNFRKG